MFQLQSEQINEIAAAMSKMQSEMQPAIKDNENPFFKKKYTDLSGIWGVCRKPLANNNLAVIQGCDVFDSKEYLITTLTHASGQWIRSRYLLMPVKNDPQAYGSAVTYARRYMLSAILGVTSEDDDGEAAMQRRSAKQEKKERETAKYNAHVVFCKSVADKIKSSTTLTDLAVAASLITPEKREQMIKEAPSLINRLDQLTAEAKEKLGDSDQVKDWEKESESIILEIIAAKTEGELDKLIASKHDTLNEMDSLKKHLYSEVSAAYKKRLSEITGGN